MALPSPALLERLTPEQRVSFLCIWDSLPTHLRDIFFDSHSPDWTSVAIVQLGDVLGEFSGVFFQIQNGF